MNSARFNGADVLVTDQPPDFPDFAAEAIGAAASRFAGRDIADLAADAAEETDWLVDGVFSSDQTTALGARSKAGKTTQLADLSVALASGTNWLGSFRVPRIRRTLFITGEANYRAISRRLLRACRARGFELEDIRGNLRVEAVDFPKLPRQVDCDQVKRIIDQFGIAVAIVDPLYRGIPAETNTDKLVGMGDAIITFAQACQPASVILSHHTTKVAAREYGKPPELEDMTGAGVAESCGNWWLLGRNCPYAWDGMHDLCVSYGGRDEQAGGRRIVFNERDWSFEVENLHDFREQQQADQEQERERRKADADDLRLHASRQKIIHACRNVTTPKSRSAIRDNAGQSGQWFNRAFAELVREQLLIVRPYRDARNRPQPEGYLLAEYVRQFDESQPKEPITDNPG